MMNLLLRKKHWPISLDIGTDSIKMLQMSQVGQAINVCASGRWRLPDSAGADESQTRKHLVTSVREMLRSGGFRGRRVVSSLPCKKLVIKNIRLPHMSDEELRKAVMWEAKERFGFDIEPDRLAYLNAGKIRQEGEIRDEVIVLAVPSNVIQDHLELLNEMGLKPEHIEPEPIAVFRVFERYLRRQADENAVSVIVDAGMSSTRVLVARGRQIVFIKEIEIGGRKFVDVVAKRLKLTREEASDLRMRAMRENPHQANCTSAEEAGPDSLGESISEGVSKANSIQWTLRDAIRAEVESLAREISLCLRYCAVTFRGLRPKHICLTGGEAYDASLVELLSENLSLPCTVGQPLRGVDVSAVDLGADRRGTLNEWAVCAGLAFRDVTLPTMMCEAENGQDRLSA